MEETPYLTTKEKMTENQNFWKVLVSKKDDQEKNLPRFEKKTYLTAEKASRKAKEAMYTEHIIRAENATREKLSSILEQIQVIAHETPLPKKTQQTVQAPIMSPGIYHSTFFEQILATIKDTQLESEKAGTWKLIVTQKDTKRKHPLQKASMQSN